MRGGNQESSTDTLKQTGFDNYAGGISGLIKALRHNGFLPARAACESASTFWELMHGALEEASIYTLYRNWLEAVRWPRCGPWPFE